MATATKLSVIPCGAMTADLTWLLLTPGRAITQPAAQDAPARWVDVPDALRAGRHPRRPAAVGHQLPARLGGALGTDRAAGLLPLRQGHRRRVPRLAAASSWASGLDEIDYVVLSHLHFDHAGNAQMFKDTNAQAGLQRQRRRTSPSTSTGLFTGAHLKADYEGLDFETVSGDTEFLPGVSCIQTPATPPAACRCRSSCPTAAP